MPEPVRVAVAPDAAPEVVTAVRDGGGVLVDASAADALVWTDPLDLDGLARTLASSPARWVQLPFAGVERFVAAGVVDPARTWTCAKGVYGPATAEHALGLTLALARRIHVHARARSWAPRTGEDRERTLDGATVVVVGTGGIGTALAGMLAPLRARVVGVNRSGRPLAGAERTVTTGALPDAVADAAFVVVAAALTPATRHLVDAALLARMDAGAGLVNVARGGLVDTDALVDALRAGAIAGAALDVTEPEPLPDDHPLWTLPAALVTPHVANTWPMALPALAALVRRNVARFARGEPLEGLVDPAAGY
ncbi:MAG TPA: NAD(P)-dependent oxidoreductase [Actinomycetota bacterium]|nr:NAD(P)-dependent oxidoreductase [Actinomycetota bacterium]